MTDQKLWNELVEEGTVRLQVVADDTYDVDQLLGECFCPKANPDIDPALLEEQRARNCGASELRECGASSVSTSAASVGAGLRPTQCGASSVMTGWGQATTTT